MRFYGWLFLLMFNSLGLTAVIIDHTSTRFQEIPSAWIDQAVVKLDIVYTHTSHGSQLTTGMMGLADFKNDPRLTFENGGEGHLDLHDSGCGDYGAWDLGNPDRTEWEAATRKYLAANPHTNVVVWSWCGQVDSASPEDISLYLSLMAGLERDFPQVKFVYMTGHMIEGARGNNHERNEQIRRFCRENDKILYDFADIECYDPDGNYFGDKGCTDGCLYDADGDGNPWDDNANWAVEWQNRHAEGVDWYSCEAAHSEAVNANQKAYAAWWLWARLAGWNGTATDSEDTTHQEESPRTFALGQNYPNPFNAGACVEFVVPETCFVDLSLYTLTGQKVKTLLQQQCVSGKHRVQVSADGFPSGVYLYHLSAGALQASRKLTVLR